MNRDWDSCNAFNSQVMLYVDGMNGVMRHGPTVQWLYSLIASKYRILVKTALKLLLVFVEYAEGNCSLLVQAIHAVDTAKGELPWSNVMRCAVCPLSVEQIILIIFDMFFSSDY